MSTRNGFPYLVFTLFFLLLFSCKNRKADVVFINGVVHTMDDSMTVSQAIAISGGKIVEVGNSSDLLSEFIAGEIIDLKGKYVYPGFIDAHCHFMGYAKGLAEVNLFGTKSWDEVVARVENFSKSHEGKWIIGRGWDQNDWETKNFPNNRLLNQKFPSTPVFLYRVDGHAAIANSSALRKSGVRAGQYFMGGYAKTVGGNLTGLLLDNAIEVVRKKAIGPSDSQLTELLVQAQSNLFQKGITTVDDAGLDFKDVFFIDSLQKAGILDLNVYAMLNPSKKNKEYFLETGPYKTEKLNVSSFKYYADGALGSRGACLLRPYSDETYNYGFLLNTPRYFKKEAELMKGSDFQMNTHCIGDSANRMIGRIYGEVLEGKNNRRWRIEHAQVVHPSDFAKFDNYSIIPSVQPVHATSDMKWAEDRIGKTRIKGAYAYKSLLKQNGYLCIGTDFPVEDIDPIKGFYAAVVRKNDQDFPYHGFFPDEALTREECLLGMTKWAAYSNFEEDEKGIIENGKSADLVVLSDDLLYTDQKEILSTKVLMTILKGEVVFSEK